MLEPLVDAAYLYAYPLYAMAQTRYRAVQDLANPRRHEANTLLHERELCDHTSRWITTPNNDTLYSNAWLDLSAGPVSLHVDRMPAGRYWSIAFMDAFTNHIEVIGQRRGGTGPMDVTIVGPGAASAGGSGHVVQAPGNDVWLFARCLVEGPHDLPAAHAMQERIQVRPSATVPASVRVVPTRSTDPQNFLAVINECLGHNPVPNSEADLLRTWASIGIRPGVRDVWQQLRDEERAAWSSRIDAAHDQLRQASAKGRRTVQGWVASAPEMGNFGSNHALRASVALGGLGALPPEEAMYFVRFHDDGSELLDGRHQYRLRVPAGGIPTDSFWSFTMYEPTADSQRFFVDNPIRRYAIGNRTPGLVHNADGSLDIALQHDAPADPTLRANWLPAPAGRFQISLRAYLPSSVLRETTAVMPSIIRN
jgi:hypothetical protein